MRHYLNHGSADEPKLRVYLNLDNLADLRPDTLWPELEGDERMVRLRADGFDGVQVTSGEPPSLGVMPFCGLGDHRPSHQQLRKLPRNGVGDPEGDFEGVRGCNSTSTPITTLWRPLDVKAFIPNPLCAHSAPAIST